MRKIRDRSFHAVIVLLAVILLTPGPLGAATFQQPGAVANVRGRVLGPDGTGVPGAAVVVVQRETGLERETRTDDRGRFVVTNLAPGLVDLTASAQGFAPGTIEGLRLEVGQTVDVEVGLEVEGLEEEVVVAGEAGLVDTTDSVVGSVVSAEEIEALPLNGRNFLELAFLTPGNVPAPTFDPTKAQSVIVSSAGQAGRGGNITIDGMDNNDDVVGGPLLNVAQDGVREFQVATNRYSAEAGRSAGSAINVVTRSGGNTLRGSAASFFRDQSWQALPATLDPGAAGDPPFDRQQVSLTLGGPVRRDRLFAFGALEIRNQDGGVLVGDRDFATRSIRTRYAPAPLDDVLGTLRADWRAAPRDDVMLRYSMQREEDIAASALERAIGSASQRQSSENRLHSLLGSWTRVISDTAVNALSVSYSSFDNRIEPVEPGVQLTFPSLQAGSSFRVPQGTTQGRLQVSDSLSLVRGAHSLNVGGQFQRVDAAFDLGVFRDGRIELVEDFPAFDRNGDGQVDDDDLLFSVTLRSGNPDRDLVLPDADNMHFAGYVQDDWRVTPQLTLNLGLRYELDTDVKNISRVDELNPIVEPFMTGERGRDLDNLAPRVGFNWTTDDARTSVHGGYGIYYDRVTLQIQSLERGLDGRSLPVEVRAGNVFFVDPMTGTIPPGAPTLSDPFTGFILPGAGASGINIIDAGLENPMVHQFSVGVERQIGDEQVVRLDLVYDKGEEFIIGRTVGSVFNPVVGGPDRVVSLESTAETEYRALLVEVQRRYGGRFGLRAAYTLSRAKNYANDDQIPFGIGPVDPDDLRREFGPAPFDRRHRLVVSGVADLGWDVSLAGIWTLSSGVPMDILMPDGQSRVPVMLRNAGGRQFESASELNAFLQEVNAAGGVDGVLLPLVSEDARFNDSFSSVDLRLSRSFSVRGAEIEAIAEIFNLFDTTNILGTTTLNYSGFRNVLTRDSEDPTDPGFLRSSSFGTPVSTAGGVFGSGGPRALQLAVRVGF